MRVQQTGGGANEPGVSIDVEVGYVWMPCRGGKDAGPGVRCGLQAKDSVVGSRHELVVCILRKGEYVAAVQSTAGLRPMSTAVSGEEGAAERLVIHHPR